MNKLQKKFFDESFVLIPSGSFWMGSDNGLPLETPVHKVEIDKDFYLASTPTTQRLWRSVMGNNPSHFQSGDLLPVENITWHEACEFCEKFGKSIGKIVRLSTEAEWEYSCRAGTTTEFYWGDESNATIDYAWFDLNSMDSTQPVGLKKPNNFGLYDMVGNVWEWCLDLWASDYSQDPVPSKIGKRSIRGGAWDMDVFRCRSAYRSSEGEEISTKKIGFRVVIEI